MRLINPSLHPYYSDNNKEVISFLLYFQYFYNPEIIYKSLDELCKLYLLIHTNCDTRITLDGTIVMETKSKQQYIYIYNKEMKNAAYVKICDE